MSKPTYDELLRSLRAMLDAFALPDDLRRVDDDKIKVSDEAAQLIRRAHGIPAAHGDLPGWTRDDEASAAREGWGIFDCDGSGNGRFQLCKRDEADTFGDDVVVWHRIATRSDSGDALCQRALAFIKLNNPVEYHAIQRSRPKGWSVAETASDVHFSDTAGEDGECHSDR
jgi:hypothetical protein